MGRACVRLSHADNPRNLPLLCEYASTARLAPPTSEDLDWAIELQDFGDGPDDDRHDGDRPDEGEEKDLSHQSQHYGADEHDCHVPSRVRRGSLGPARTTQGVSNDKPGARLRKNGARVPFPQRRRRDPRRRPNGGAGREGEVRLERRRPIRRSRPWKTKAGRCEAPRFDGLGDQRLRRRYSVVQDYFFARSTQVASISPKMAAVTTMSFSSTGPV